MNKKLIKTLTCIAGITAIGSTVGIISASCGSSSDTPVEDKVLPEGVYNISDGTLNGFTQVFLNNPDAYSDCNTMEIPSSVTSIADNAFYPNYSSTIPSFITKLTFAERSVCFSINELAFFDCASITSIDFSNCSNLSSIGYRAFWNCSLIASITFPNSLQTISQNAFTKCSSITSMVFPNNLQTIGKNAFTECSSITSIDFSKSINLSSIGENAFGFCPSIEDIKIDNDTFHTILLGSGKAVVKNETTPNQWNDSSVAIGSLACGDIEFPSDVTSIASSAFYSCASITSIDFSNCSNLSSIGSGAFLECSSITSVTFPNNLQTIYQHAFRNCSSLNSIIWDGLSNNPSTSIGSDTFNGISPKGTVKVTNASGGYTSKELLDWLQGKDNPSTGIKGNFPTEDWEAI